MKTPNTPFATRLSGRAKETELRLRSIVQWKKKHPPLVLALLMTLVVLLCGSLVSCQARLEEEQPDFSPIDAVYELFNETGMTVTLHLANEGAWNTYTATDRYYAERFEVLLSGYQWETLEMPSTQPSEFWLTAASMDGAKSMTFWSGMPSMIQYNDGEETTYWQAMQTGGVAENIRLEYDNLDMDYSRIAFEHPGSAAEAAEHFVQSAFAAHQMTLAPGNMYRITDYAVIDWSVREVSQNGTAVVGGLQYAFVPCDMNSPGIWAGNTGQATGEYEGMLDAYREFVLQKQGDGLWHCIGLGTGGYQLPETEEAEQGNSSEENAPTLSYDFLRNYEFHFSSGAGAWGTQLVINPDGSFSGQYSDSDMGDSGEGYPNGTRYLSSFEGKFYPPEQVNEYTYSVRISEVSYERIPGTEELLDGIRYIYSDAYGLQNTDSILIYLPGAPLSELPADFLWWVGYYDISSLNEQELPFFGLYNPVEKCGFKGYDVVEGLKQIVAATEQQAASLEELAQNLVTQADMNINAKQLYEIWDYVLNHQWAVLKQVLSKSAMDDLLIEQRAWIAKKEQAVAEAGAEVEGGSIYPTVTYSLAAQMTRDRVYELMDYLR